MGAPYTWPRGRRHPLDLRRPEGRAAPPDHGGGKLKLVVRQPRYKSREFEGIRSRHFSPQPRDRSPLTENRCLVIEFSLRHPLWCLSL
jgi:hypothetical protein